MFQPSEDRLEVTAGSAKVKLVGNWQVKVSAVLALCKAMYFLLDPGTTSLSSLHCCVLNAIHLKHGARKWEIQSCSKKVYLAPEDTTISAHMLLGFWLDFWQNIHSVNYFESLATLRQRHQIVPQNQSLRYPEVVVLEAFHFLDFPRMKCNPELVVGVHEILLKSFVVDQGQEISEVQGQPAYQCLI